MSMTKMVHAPFDTAIVLDNIRHERLKQDLRWGEQHHPDGTTPLFKIDADRYRRLADRAARDGTLTWRHILTEEFFEAMAERDAELLRAELVQVAAVAVAWIEDIDSRTYGEPAAKAA